MSQSYGVFFFISLDIGVSFSLQKIASEALSFNDAISSTFCSDLQTKKVVCRGVIAQRPSLSNKA